LVFVWKFFIEGGGRGEKPCRIINWGARGGEEGAPPPPAPPPPPPLNSRVLGTRVGLDAVEKGRNQTRSVGRSLQGLVTLCRVCLRSSTRASVRCRTVLTVDGTVRSALRKRFNICLSLHLCFANV